MRTRRSTTESSAPHSLSVQVGTWFKAQATGWGVIAMAILLVLFAALVLASPALADPCKLIPDGGPPPPSVAPGRTFAGPVVYVGDGDGLCVATTPGHERDLLTWAEVRLADFYSPELHEAGGPQAKAALERIAMGRWTICKSQKRSYDRVVARCVIGRISIGDRMHAAGIAEGGRGKVAPGVSAR